MSAIGATAPRLVASAASHSAPFVAEWLAGLFLAPPDADEVTRLSSCEAQDGLAMVGATYDCEDAIAQLRKALHAGPPALVAADLTRDYMLLFEGVTRHRTVSLYESTYGGAGRLFQQPVDDMDDLLRRLDMSVRDTCREPVDHVSIELAALAEACRRGEADIAQVIATRMLSWTPRLEAGCRLHAQTEFYACAATVLTAFLAAFLRELCNAAQPLDVGVMNRVELG